MTLIVNQLETYDKKNLEVIRIEFAKLQKKLEDCQNDQGNIKPDIGKATHQRYMINDKCTFLIIFTSLFSIQATAITLES